MRRPVDGQTIAERLALPEIVGRLLAQRGIDLDHAPGFLKPRLRDQLPEPLQLRDMDAAAPRGSRAPCEAGETIAIFGDYDVDGATSAALLTSVFRRDQGAYSTGIYVPDRLREGYGPNSAALLRLHAEGDKKVVVTVDCVDDRPSAASPPPPIAVSKSLSSTIMSPNCCCRLQRR